MSGNWDVIVVGARCAGSPTAMLLARAGLSVLVVDRATFPSDTISTHVVQPLAAARLARWGLLDRVVATGCPPISTYAYDFGPFTIAGSPGTPDAPVGWCPRRTVLDAILVEAAAGAGAEVREGFRVEEVLVEDGRVVGIRGATRDGAAVTERARVVIGADGWRSRLAETVGAGRYHEKPGLLANYYTYYSGLPMDGRFEIYIRPRRGIAAAPTNDGRTLVIAGWPATEFESKKSDVERHFHETIALAPRFAERLAAGKREEKFAGAVVPNWFRKPFGPGWALVGDAGYLKDPITAQGIHDAFRDAELLATALLEHFRDGRDWDEALGAYQRERDEDSLAMYEFTTRLATLEPPSPEQAPLFRAIHASRAASDDFARMHAGTISPATFFAPENIGRILGSGPGAAA